ncbi:MAG: hypothetical protein ABIQ93_11565 [Saprospiraceae bacterium]
MRRPTHFTLRFLLALAVSSLVLNDVARLVFPQVQQMVMQTADEEKQEGKNPTSTLFEEEVKHKTCEVPITLASLIGDLHLDAAITHRITDDEVRHLAFLAIFSPPPNRA